MEHLVKENGPKIILLVKIDEIYNKLWYTYFVWSWLDGGGFMKVASGIPRSLPIGRVNRLWLCLSLVAGLLVMGLPGPASGQKRLWQGHRTAPRFDRSRNWNPSTYQVHRNQLRQIDRYGAVATHQIRELAIGPRGQYTATVIDRRGQPSHITLPKDTTLGVQPLDSNLIVVTDALKRRQIVRVDRITYDALGNATVVYRDSKGRVLQLPMKSYEGLRPGLQALYSKSVEIRDELGQVQTVRLERLFRDTSGAMKAEVTGPEGITKTIDARQIVGTIPEGVAPPPPKAPTPPPPEPLGPETPPTTKPPTGALLKEPSASAGPGKFDLPSPGQRGRAGG